ncbi:MAG: peptidoglycan DD-metalloendopeptidase family protein [Bacteroidales bacterium]|nr:peptidoglycan DD-metalloendopeptidase family protein [Bacteroidales bacterium]
MKISKGIIGVGIVMAGLVCEVPVVTAVAAPKEAGVTQTNKKKTGKSSGKSSSSKKGAGTSSKRNSGRTSSKGSAKRKSGPVRQETSADVQRKHDETRKEIKLTEEQIRANEAKIKKSLGDLNRINGEIAETKIKVNNITAQVNKLNSEIGTLEKQIKNNEEALALLRAEYLKAVKKMRQSKQNQSTLAFIFASDNFNQALRRMRYLKQFSSWKEKQSDEINKKVEQLKRQTALLEQTRRDKDRVLQAQVSAQQTLEKQGRQQDALVVELRKNGEALKSHLARKQAEANTLKSRIASLIAAEQQKAAAEKAAREAREREARERAERESREAAQREAARKEAEEKAAAEANKKEKQTVKETPKKETAAKENKTNKGGKDYADARKRKPRGDSGNSSTSSKGNTRKESSASTATTSKNTSAAPAVSMGGGNFAAMRGSLPRPVDGAWRVTSRFGRHALPDLPDVMYDNPGIDAEVSRGATAKAVFGGKVTGVYMIPGFGTVVIVNHGDYFTVYGNLASVSVKSSDTVKQGQAIGKVGEDPDDPGHSSIHFEVWKNRDKMNPLEWIR